MFVCCMFLELGLGVVLNLNCHGTLLEPSVLEFWFKCFGILCTSLLFCVAVVLLLWTFSMGCWSLLVWPSFLKGLNSSPQHVGYGKVSMTGRPALSKAHPEFQDSWIPRGMLSTGVTVQSLMHSAQLPRLCHTKLG